MSLKEALAGVKQGQAEPESVQVPQTTKPPEKKKAATVRTTGKSSDDDYERLTVYVLKTTKRDAGRKWEDATGKDMSDLVQQLLAKYRDT